MKFSLQLLGCWYSSVHIKVHVPEIVRKQTLHKHTVQRQKRPHYAKRWPSPQTPYYATNIETDAIYAPLDMPLPAPLPLVTSEHEIFAHVGAMPVTVNDIRTNSLHTQYQQQHEPQIRLQTILPPPLTAPLSAPQSLALHTIPTSYNEPDTYATSNIADANALSSADVLKDLQQYQQEHIYYEEPKHTLAPPLMATTLTNNQQQNKNFKKKKRKHANTINSSSGVGTNNNNNYEQLNMEQYYSKVQSQPSFYATPQIEEGFKPYSVNQAYSNYYYNNYNNNNKNKYSNYDSSNYIKKHKFKLMDTPQSDANLSADNDDTDVEQNTAEEEEDYTDNRNDMMIGFNAPIQAADDDSNSDEYPLVAAQFQTTNPTNVILNPSSYQQLYATYTATPAVKQKLSTTPTGLKYKNHYKHYPQQQQQAYESKTLVHQQQPQQQRAKQQFIQLSSTAPIIATGFDGLSSTVLAPTISTTSADLTTTPFVGPHVYASTQPKRYRNHKNHIKIKRNYITVH